METNPIVNWLETYRSYKPGVELFRTYGIEKYPKIFELVSRGNYPGNRELLEHHLKLLAKEIQLIDYVPEKAAPTVSVDYEPVHKEIKTDQAEVPGAAIAAFSNLNKEISESLRKRMQLSQSFHDCSTDYERSLVCDSIDVVNDHLTDLNSKKEYFDINGKMPPEVDDSFKLATTEDGLAIQQNRKHSYKLKVKRAIEEMLLYEEGHRKRRKLHEKQQLYKQLLSEIESIKNARKKIKGE